MNKGCVEDMRAVKNDAEVRGMRRAYLRDGVSFVRNLPSSSLLIKLIQTRRRHDSWPGSKIS